MTRSYTDKTKKLLFALSGNRCSFDDCDQPLAVADSLDSGPYIVGEIAHICGLKEGSKRFDPTQAAADRNDYSNLILLCPTHHAMVDAAESQFEARALREMKARHQAKVEQRLAADPSMVDATLFSHQSFPRDLVDRFIEDSSTKLRKRRYFIESEPAMEARRLSRQLTSGELKGGSATTRATALAWCARILSTSDSHRATADSALRAARELESCIESTVADAYLSRARESEQKILAKLAKLNSPIARTAAYQIVRLERGSVGALDWTKSAGIQFCELDADGKFTQLLDLIDVEDWDGLETALPGLTEEDLTTTPALFGVAARAQLTLSVAPDLRASISDRVPIAAREFPLMSTIAALERRKIAIEHANAGAQSAILIDCPTTAEKFSLYGLWLELRDPQLFESARERLKGKIDDDDVALAYLPLALDFGLPLDPEDVEIAISSYVELRGGPTGDSAIARLVAAITQGTPAAVLDYIDTHRAELLSAINNVAIVDVEVRALCQLNRFEEAIGKIESASSLSDEARSDLERLVEQLRADDPSDEAKLRYSETGDLRDLALVVAILEESEDWAELLSYAKELCSRTESLDHFRTYITALRKTHNHSEIVALIERRNELVSQDSCLAMCHAWALFHAGRLKDATTQLRSINDYDSTTDGINLRINLAIFGGKWDELTGIVAMVADQPNAWRGEDLLEVAKLSARVGSPDTLRLLKAAVSRTDSDSAILSGAYLIATSIGLDDRADVAQWLNSAVADSDDNTAVTMLSMRELMDLRPEWERRSERVWALVKSRDMPLAAAASALNLSVARLTLVPALANSKHSDTRSAAIVPTFSGSRVDAQPDLDKVVGFDPSALITLALTAKLQTVLERCKAIVLPHSTLSWLFDELQRVTHHQPTEIKRAQRILHLVAQGTMTIFEEHGATTADLCFEVGDELAAMLTATKDGTSRTLVVHGYPIYKAGSLLFEEADIDDFAHSIVSSSSIIEYLRTAGLMTQPEVTSATSQLRLREKSWFQEPKIQDDVTILLDDVSARNLEDLGLLELMSEAGLSVKISKHFHDHCVSQSKFEVLSSDAVAALQVIHEELAAAIGTGRATLSSSQHGALEKPNAGVLLSLELTEASSCCEAMIIDDRFFNKFPMIGEGEAKTAIYSSLEFVGALHARQLLSETTYFHHLTELRRFGYAFVPASSEELQHYLTASEHEDGAFQETRELRVFRQYTQHVCASAWLQLPEELPWMMTLTTVGGEILRLQWTGDVDSTVSEARSNWILQWSDPRLWLHLEPTEGSARPIDDLWRRFLSTLLVPLKGVPDQTIQTYFEWLDRTLINEIEVNDPELFELLVANAKAIVRDATMATGNAEQASGK